jgi:hypothetical protein
VYLGSDLKPAARLRLFRLATNAVLLVWDADTAPRARDLRAVIDGREVAPPFAKTHLALADGRIRNLLATRLAAPIHVLPEAALTDRSGATIAETEQGLSRIAESIAFDAPRLLAGLDAEARVRLARFLLDIVPNALAVARDPQFVRSCRILVGDLNPAPEPFAWRCCLFGRWLVGECVVAADLGPRLTPVLVTEDALSRPLFNPVVQTDRTDDRAVQRLAFVVDRSMISDTCTLAILGEHGLACRSATLDASGLQGPEAWLARSRSVSRAARWCLMDTLDRIHAEHDRAAALARELRAARPAPKPPADEVRLPLSVTLEPPLATPAGVFVTGRIDDRNRLVQGLVMESARSHLPQPPLWFERFEIASGEADQGGRGEGFVALFAAAAADTPCAIKVRLGSGRTIEVGEGPDVLDPAATLERVLKAVPDPVRCERIVSEYLAPVAHALLGQMGELPGQADTVDIGTPPAEPAATIVIGPGVEPEIVRSRTAALALDPDLADAEVLYIVRDDERGGVLRAFLGGLHATYGLPCRLVIVPSFLPTPLAVNAAVAAARAERVVLLHAGVVPLTRGWLRRMAEAADTAGAHCGAVGARVLHEDGAIRCAGGEFATDDGGRWDIERPWLGFPGAFAPATATRLVTVAPRGCLTIARALFQRLGGFDHGYFTMRAAEADLCARIWQAGQSVVCVAEPSVVDLSPPLKGESGPFAGGAAEAADGARLETRWKGTADTLKRVETPAGGKRVAKRTRKAPAGRRQRKAS